MKSRKLAKVCSKERQVRDSVGLNETVRDCLSGLHFMTLRKLKLYSLLVLMLQCEEYEFVKNHDCEIKPARHLRILRRVLIFLRTY